MTAIVGVLCRDGLVIGTDSSATFTSGNMRTIEQPVEKLTIVAGTVIIAGAGQVGMGQRFNHVVQGAYDQKIFKGHHIEVAKELCRLGIADFMFTSAQKGAYAALVGFPIHDKPYLCEFASGDFQPEFKDERMWYCSMGSGQPITDPFLALIREIFWMSGPPTVQDATFAVTWALDHAVAVNPGGINAPVRIAVMERVGGKLASRILDDNDLQEHRQNIDQAKERLRSYPAAQKPDASDTPAIPKPK
jgi:20S proteasome alpha/beta subunit